MGLDELNTEALQVIQKNELFGQGYNVLLGYTLFLSIASVDGTGSIILSRLGIQSGDVFQYYCDRELPFENDPVEPFDLSNIKLAAKLEAQSLSSSYIGSEHLLIAVLATFPELEEYVKSKYGVTAADVRKAVIEAQSIRPIESPQRENMRRFFRNIDMESNRQSLRRFHNLSSMVLAHVDSDYLLVFNALRQWCLNKAQHNDEELLSRADIIAAYPWLIE